MSSNRQELDQPTHLSALMSNDFSDFTEFDECGLRCAPRPREVCGTPSQVAPRGGATVEDRGWGIEDGAATSRGDRPREVPVKGRATSPPLLRGGE